MPKKVQYHHEILNQLKAEVFCAELLSKGFSFDDIAINHLGSFRKSYRNDVGEVTVLTDEYEENKNIKFKVDIHRDSIYDRLPEGLFHQTRGGSNTSATKDMVGEYRRYRNEEKQARKFFHPFDQEIFRYSTLVEQMEQELSIGMLDGDIRNELSNFWNIGKNLPQSAVSVLLRIMPWAHQIKGNLEMTSKALESMLGKKVTAVQTYQSIQQKVGDTLSLGEGLLGVDTLNGTFFADTSINWVFTIHDVSKKEMLQYPPSEPYGKFLQQFEEIFIPLSVDVSYNYGINHNTDNDAEPVLGYSLVL